jgi:aminoglycoside/choline kinase family phosphotransferase
MNVRKSIISEFLAKTNWANALRAPLAGDASLRKYQRLAAGKDGRVAVLMDADPKLGNDVRPFIKITNYLRSLSLSAPEIYAADEASGLLIIEDLGDDLYAKAVADKPELEIPLYEAATDVLLHLHKAPPPSLLPYDTKSMTDMALLAFDWYQFGASDKVNIDHRDTFKTAFSHLLETRISAPSVLIQRDYHAENLLWLSDRKGHARVGLLDYQDAQLGHPAYDLVSMLKDARRDVPESVEEAMVQHYVTHSAIDDQEFRDAYHLLGLQRNLRILGVFARLSMHFAKPHYVDFIPRVWNFIQRDLGQKINEPVGTILNETLPTPTPEILIRLKDKCATIPTL